MMNYWNKKIPEWNNSYPPAYFNRINISNGYSYQKVSNVNSPWIKMTIGKNSYYGKSLKGKNWEKTKIIAGKIIPLFVVSIFFAPISIPLLFATGTYRKLGVWIREIHYNSTLDYKIKALAINPGANPSPSLDAPQFKDFLPQILNSPYFESDQDSKKFFNAINCVSKGFVQKPKETEITLINSEKLLLKDIPSIKNKDDALKHILSYGSQLKVLDISDFMGWTDKDLQDIVSHCPNLETFIMKRTIAHNPLDEIGKLKNLKKLHLGGCFHGRDQIICTSLDNLIHLEDLKLEEASAIPSLEKLTKLKKIALTSCQGPFPSLDQLYKLKELVIYNCEMPTSFDGLLNLRKLTIDQFLIMGNNIPSLNKLKKLTDLNIFAFSSPIPSLKELTNLKRLSIVSMFNKEIDLAPSAPLEALFLSCPLVDKLPETDPSKLKILSLKGSFDLNKKLNQFTELREYYTDGNFYLLPNQLNHLEKLQARNLYIENVGWQIPQNVRNKIKSLSILENVSKIPNFDDFNNLEELNLHHLQDHILATIDHMSKLRQLTISRCKHLKHFPSLKKVSSLQRLSFLNCKNFKNPSLSKLENLKYLEIRKCPRVKENLKLDRLFQLEELYIDLGEVDIGFQQKTFRKQLTEYVF